MVNKEVMNQPMALEARRDKLEMVEPFKQSFGACPASISLEKPPTKQYHDDDSHPYKWSILLQKQLPINSHRRLSVLFAILSQPATHLPHPLQTIPSIQQILDIFGHHLRDIS